MAEGSPGPNGFSLGPPGARAGLALAGLLAASGARLLAPRVSSSLTGDPTGYYVVASLLDLALALPALALLRRAGRLGAGRAALAGALGGLGAYLALLGAAGLLGLLGSTAGGLLGRLLLALYMAAYSLAVGLGLYSLALAASPGDEATGSAAGGAVYSLLVAWPMAAAGRDPVEVLGVAASTMALAGAAVAVAYALGGLGGALFLGTLQALAVAGPWSLGGSVLEASALLALSAAAGWLVALAYTGGLGAPRAPRLGRRGLALLVALAAAAGGAWHLYSEGVMFWRPLVIVTGSMEPALDRGDLVILERVDPGELRVGDIITFRVGDVYVTHRIVGVVDGGFQTKGDANPAPDPYLVRPDQVVGRVWLVVPKAGWLAILLNWNPTVRLAVVAGASAAIAYLALRGGGEKSPRRQG